MQYSNFRWKYATPEPKNDVIFRIHTYVHDIIIINMNEFVLVYIFGGGIKGISREEITAFVLNHLNRADIFKCNNLILISEKY